MNYTVHSYMWENYFKPKYEVLPYRRRDDKTIATLKKLIGEMYTAGYSANAIGKYLDKDHTTILHHLNTKDIPRRSYFYRDPKDTLQQEKERTKKQREQQLLRLQIKAEKEKRAKVRAKEKEKKAQAKLDAEKEKRHKWEEKRKNTALLREKVFALYEQGSSYKDILFKTGLKPTQTQALLIYHPKYRKIAQERYHHKGRPVTQYTKDGKKVATYKNMSIAARETGTFRGTISVVCRGRIPSAKGYVWKYADEVISK